MDGWMNRMMNGRRLGSNKVGGGGARVKVGGEKERWVCYWGWGILL